MNSIRYGAKLWSTNPNLYGDFVRCYKEGKADYLELLYIPGKVEDINILINNKIPVVIHAPNFNQGVFFANDKFGGNTKILLETLELAKKFNTPQVILHPDVGEKENFIKFLEIHKDKKLIIENMPKMALDGSICLGYTIKEIKGFLKIGDFDFCLDFGHAIKSAISQGIDYKKFLEKIIKLNPKIVHLCDGKLNNEKDEHLNLGDGDFDLKFIAELIKCNNIEKITFEVPKKDGLSNDIKNVDTFKFFLNKSY